jgi:hypothetical protein
MHMGQQGREQRGKGPLPSALSFPFLSIHLSPPHLSIHPFFNSFLHSLLLLVLCPFPFLLFSFSSFLSHHREEGGQGKKGNPVLLLMKH